jgi:hypothetical protein
LATKASIWAKVWPWCSQADSRRCTSTTFWAEAYAASASAGLMRRGEDIERDCREQLAWIRYRAVSMRIRDDRGKETELSRQAATWRKSPRIVWRPRHAGELSAKEVTLGLVVLIGGPVGLVIGAIGAIGVGAASGRWGGPVGLLAAVVWVVVVSRLFRRRLNRMARGQALAQEECPACGYGLKGIPRQEDQCRVCPECGAAWRS